MHDSDPNGMADAPYLVALALFDQGGKRAMPLAGKSQTEVVAEGEAPGSLGKELALDLLLRVWQRSDEGPLQRAAAAASLSEGAAADLVQGLESVQRKVQTGGADADVVRGS